MPLKDDPAARAGIAVHPATSRALNRSTLGKKEGLAAITREDLVRGWAERARPIGSIFAVAGAMDPDAVTAVDELFQGWSGSYAEATPGCRGTRVRARAG